MHFLVIFVNYVDLIYKKENFNEYTTLNHTLCSSKLQYKLLLNLMQTSILLRFIYLKYAGEIQYYYFVVNKSINQAAQWDTRGDYDIRSYYVRPTIKLS